MKPFTLLLFSFFLMGSTVSFGQAWKSSEQKQSINREAAVKKKLVNNENALKAAKDDINQAIYTERIELLNSILMDIASWRQQIEAGNKENAQRYNLISNLKIGKSDAMQFLIGSRSSELLYEAFGGTYKEEPIGILATLRSDLTNNLKAYETAIEKVKSNIQ